MRGDDFSETDANIACGCSATKTTVVYLNAQNYGETKRGAMADSPF